MVYIDLPAWSQQSLSLLSVSPRLSLRVSVWHLIDDTSYRVSESLITAGASHWSVSTHTGLWLVTGPHVTSPPAPSRLILSTNVRQFGQKRLIFCCAVFIYLHRQGNISHFPPQQEFTALLEYWSTHAGAWRESPQFKVHWRLPCPRHPRYYQSLPSWSADF